MQGWTTIETPDGGRHLRFTPLLEAGVGHVFTLRPLPGSARKGSGRPGEPLPDIPDDLPVARPRQVHGGIVAIPAPGGRCTDPAEADAVVVNRPGAGAAVATADCVGAVLAVPGSSCFAVIHAGWRGVLAEIVRKAVERLHLVSGTSPAGMMLVMGPSAGGCCYEVGDEVLEPFTRLFGESRATRPLFGTRGDRRTVEPAAAVGIQAEMAGLRREDIHYSGICTMCRPDLCWSHRIQGESAGRMLAAAMVLPQAPLSP